MVRTHRGSCPTCALLRCVRSLLLALTSVAVALGSATAADAATFASGPCPVADPPLTALKDARCGFLTVPEHRDRPDGRTIRLRVAIIPARSKTPAPDPVVYLTGGPGGSAISAAQNVVN